MLNGFREAFGYVPSTINRRCSGVVGNTRHIGTLAKRQRAPIGLPCIDQVEQYVEQDVLP
jgi:hypothetical protein